jgi:hypothetical protein
MSVETEARLTIGWRVDADDIPDFELRNWNTNWSELRPLAKQASETLCEEVYIEDLCEEENAMVGDTYIVGVSAPKRELPMESFLTEMKKRADFARHAYEQVMRKPPSDGPYMISWTHVW